MKENITVAKLGSFYMATAVSRPTLGVKHNYLITLIVLGCNSLIIFVLYSPEQTWRTSNGKLQHLKIPIINLHFHIRAGEKSKMKHKVKKKTAIILPVEHLCGAQKERRETQEEEGGRCGDGEGGSRQSEVTWVTR